MPDDTTASDGTVVFPPSLLAISGGPLLLHYAFRAWFSFAPARIELKYGCCIARTAEMRLAGS